MKKSLLAILIGLVLVLGACGGGGDDDAAEEPADNDTATEEEATDDGAADEGAGEEAADEGTEEGGTVDTAAAEEVYQNTCAACHGADLSGGAGPDLTAIGNELSAEEIADIIQNGQGGMPPQNVEGEDLDNISNWLAEKK